jgi:competence protein ComEA
MKSKTILLTTVLLALCSWQVYDYVRQAPAVYCDPVQVEEPLPRKIMVYVTGAVRNPGLYQFDKPVRVAEVLQLAGDALPYADLTAINGADVVQDGMHIHLPYCLEGTPAPSGGGQDLVSLNSADLKQLETLPGIGPATAKLILSYREEHGPFTVPDDLKKVKGIGQAKWDKIKDKVTL